jgi:protein-S-isoprenylcysteine O-methyltransferase Ste14
MPGATPARHTSTKAVALACCLLGLAGAAALALLVLLLGTGTVLDVPRLPLGWAWAADLAWLVAFGLQHSVMARDGFKRHWTRLVSPRLERSVYVGLSGLLLLGLSLTWQPLDGPAWWRGPLALLLVPLAAAVGLGLVSRLFDHGSFFGLCQAWSEDGSAPPETLLVAGPYRYVRHPLMACLLVFLWAQPVMPPTLALLSGGLSAYVALGLALEERDLLRRFHPAYAAYRRRVPALVPWRRPIPSAPVEDRTPS